MKYYTIEDAEGGLLGYVKAKDDVDAYDKVLEKYPNTCPDNLLINEIDKRDIERYILRILKKDKIIKL